MNQYANQDVKSTGRQFESFRKSLELFKSLKLQLITIAGVLFFVPMVVFDLYQASVAAENLDKLRSLDQQGQLKGIVDYLEAALSYGQQYILSWVAAATFGALGYLTVIATSLHYLKRGFQGLSLSKLIRHSFAVLIKRGLITAILCFILFLVIANLTTAILGAFELLQFVFIFLLAYALLIPVLLVATISSPLRIIKQALTLSIVPKIRGLKLSLFFQLLTITFLLMFAMMAIGYLGDWVLNADLHTKLDAADWFAAIPALGVSQAFAVSSLAQSALFSLALTFTAVFTSVFYGNVTNPQFIALIQQLIRSRSHD